jgi:hypothetical protein
MRYFSQEASTGLESSSDLLRGGLGLCFLFGLLVLIGDCLVSEGLVGEGYCFITSGDLVSCI